MPFRLGQLELWPIIAVRPAGSGAGAGFLYVLAYFIVLFMDYHNWLLLHVKPEVSNAEIEAWQSLN